MKRSGSPPLFPFPRSICSLARSASTSSFATVASPKLLLHPFVSRISGAPSARIREEHETDEISVRVLLQRGLAEPDHVALSAVMLAHDDERKFAVFAATD